MTIAPEFIKLGTQAYADTYEQMRSLVKAESFNNQIWLLEHPQFIRSERPQIQPCLNQEIFLSFKLIGRRGYLSWPRPARHLFFTGYQTKKNRTQDVGSKLTKPYSKNLQHYSIESSFVEGAPGVYVEKKNCIHWLRISKGRTYHGISLNVDMDLTPFSLINPCGYEA